MSPYYFALKKSRKVRNWVQVADGTIYEISSADELVHAGHRSLTNVITGNGDFHTPNDQAYRKEELHYLVGSASGRTGYPGIYSSNTDREGVMQPMAQPASAINTDMVYNQALSRLHDKMRSTIDLSVSIAQRGQVASMLASTAKLVTYVRRSPIRALRSAFKDFRTGVRGAGSKWLEFQYGWKPLAQDIYNTANQIIEGRDSLTKVKVRASEEMKRKLKYPDGNLILWVDALESHRVELSIEFKPLDGELQYLSNFTSLNPASIIWELTPWSFVVDWFVDIGGYMRAMETSLLLSNSFKSGYITTTSRDLYEGYTSFQGFHNSFNWTESSKGSFKRTSKSRSRLGAMPFPRLPSFKANLGSGRLLNAAGLLSQFLRK